MKIVIINKFLYPRGGDCICALNLRKLLEANGHEVRFFAMDYAENLPFPETKYFPEEVSFSAGGIKNKLNAIGRVVFGTGTKSRFTQLLHDFNPDVVHLHNIHSYLSPALAQVAHSKGIKVVWTLHDYKLICPAYSCLHHDAVCEACFTDKQQVLRRKCMKGSLVASGLAYVEALQWNKKKLSAWTDEFICPSQFMASKMNQGGYDKKKLSVLCNFIDDEKVQLIQATPQKEQEEAYCYVGRLSKEKGVEHLLQAASTLARKLYVAGGGPLADALKQQYHDASNIVFLGHLSSQEIIALFKKVRFSIIPSICYENNPLSVIESLCCGTPVLGANIGGIPELMSDESCELFDCDDLSDMKEKIECMFQKQVDSETLSEVSLRNYSSDNHYKKLLSIYKKVISG